MHSFVVDWAIFCVLVAAPFFVARWVAARLMGRGR